MSVEEISSIFQAIATQCHSNLFLLPLLPHFYSPEVVYLVSTFIAYSLSFDILYLLFEVVIVVAKVSYHDS